MTKARTSRKAKTKSKSKFQTKQLALIVAAFVLVGVGALVITHAKGINTVSVYGASSCPGGVWAVDARLTSNVSRIDVINVDVYDQTDNPAGYRKLASNLTLTYNAPFTFQFKPTSTQRNDKIFLTSVGADPARASFVGEARVTNPCK